MLAVVPCRKVRVGSPYVERRKQALSFLRLRQFLGQDGATLGFWDRPEYLAPPTEADAVKHCCLKECPNNRRCWDLVVPEDAFEKLRWVWPAPSPKQKGMKADAVVSIHTQRVRLAVSGCFDPAGVSPSRERPEKVQAQAYFSRFTWAIKGTRVCRKFFFSVLGIPLGSMHQYVCAAVMGHQPQLASLVSLAIPRQRLRKKKDLIRAFFFEDARQSADTMPGRATGGPLLRSSNRFTSRDVPQQFVFPHSKYLHVYIQFFNWAALQLGEGGRIPCFPYFWKTWQQDEQLRSTFVLARDKGTHSTCKWCVGWRHLLTLKSLDTKHRETVREKLLEHLRLQRGQRDYYDGRVRQAKLICAIERPLTAELWLSLAMDGFDGRKSRLPFMKNYAGTFESLVLQLTLMGVVVHHVGVFFYYWDETVVGGSNTSVECLRQTLLQLQRIFTERHWRWPKNIAIQLDNTTKDNKNRFVLGFTADLVLRAKYTLAEVNFLMKGHTHNDVDQRFGHIWTYLCRLKVVQTLEVYEHVVSIACGDAWGEPLLAFQRILVPFDHKKFYLEFLEPLSNFTGAHHFRFFLDPRGSVLMKYKRWAEFKLWLPIDPSRREQHGEQALKDARSVMYDSLQHDERMRKGGKERDGESDEGGTESDLKDSDVLGAGVHIFGAHPPKDDSTPDLAELRHNLKKLTDFVAGLRRMIRKANEDLPMHFPDEVVQGWHKMLDEHEASLLSIATGQYTAEYSFPFRVDEMDAPAGTEEGRQAVRVVRSFATASLEHRGDDREEFINRKSAGGQARGRRKPDTRKQSQRGRSGATGRGGQLHKVDRGRKRALPEDSDSSRSPGSSNEQEDRLTKENERPTRRPRREMSLRAELCVLCRVAEGPEMPFVRCCVCGDAYHNIDCSGLQALIQPGQIWYCNTDCERSHKR